MAIWFVEAPISVSVAYADKVNARELKEDLDLRAHRHINTDSDSEIMLNVFAEELNKTGLARVNAQDIFDALSRMYKRCVGGWACTGMIAGLLHPPLCVTTANDLTGYGLIGFRDAYGIRPLVWGRRKTADGSAYDYMMASESIALKQKRFMDIQDVLPGQAIIIRKNGQPIIQEVEKPIRYAPDLNSSTMHDQILSWMG